MLQLELLSFYYSVLFSGFCIGDVSDERRGNYSDAQLLRKILLFGNNDIVFFSFAFVKLNKGDFLILVKWLFLEDFRVKASIIFFLLIEKKKNIPEKRKI